jgi:DNA mismatch endonuclease (patch repair protein)
MFREDVIFEFNVSGNSLFFSTFRDMAGYKRDGRAPIPDTESTSRSMAGNRSKNTKPEIMLRKALWKSGDRGYRLHPKQLPGRPDIVFGHAKLAVFINGCFWHRCPTCDLPKPRSNAAFWQQKFDVNVARDKKKVAALEDKGWQILTIWECEIKRKLPECLERIREVIKP